jgi:3-deoxy-D-manno-octulosonic-acid transferase
LQHVDAFLAQSEEDRRRLIAIGAAPERVRVSGNLKFEVRAPAGSRLVDNLRRQIAESRVRPVLVFGSTVEGEEALLIPTFRAVLERFPKTLVVVAPRHPERFAAVAELLAASGVRFWKRSEWNGSQSLSGGILLLDSIGELASVYALAEVAFVGGSLVSRGGHNIVEPAQHGAAIVIGPHTENFRDVVAIFRQADAVRVVEPAALSALVVELLTNDTARRELGQRARYVVSAQSGATARTVAALDELLRDRGPATKLPASLPIEVK